MIDANCSIVVPCYNEAKRFQEAEFARILQQEPRLRICFVDDGSTDGTVGILQQFCKQFSSQADCFSLAKNQGKAEAVRQGLIHVACLNDPIVGYWDADLATPIDMIPEFVEYLSNKPTASFVLGSRVRLLGWDIERRPLRHYLGRVFATMASIAIKLPVYDTQCGAKMFRNGPWVIRVLDRPFLSRWAFDVELLSRYLLFCEEQQQSSGLVELPLRSWTDIDGSKVKLSAALSAFLALMRIGLDHRIAIRRLRNRQRVQKQDSIQAIAFAMSARGQHDRN